MTFNFTMAVAGPNGATDIEPAEADPTLIVPAAPIEDAAPSSSERLIRGVSRAAGPIAFIACLGGVIAGLWHLFG